MPYYNDRYDRRGGGYRNDRDYDYRDRGYDRRDSFDRMNSHGRFRFDIGQRVIHKATGTELSVVSFGREQLECRKPDLSTVWLYEHELEPAPGDK